MSSALHRRLPLLLLVALPTAGEARPWSSGTTIYADLCEQAETRETRGHRITLRRSPNGNAVLYEGAAPASVTLVRFDEAAGTLAFTAETCAGPVAFEGVAGSGALTGTVTDTSGAHALNLPRVLRVRAAPCGGR